MLVRDPDRVNSVPGPSVVAVQTTRGNHRLQVPHVRDVVNLGQASLRLHNYASVDCLAADVPLHSLRTVPRRQHETPHPK